MTKKYWVQINEIDPIIEEMVVLTVQGVTLRCFASYCPSVIEVGKTYQGEFEMVLPEDVCISTCETHQTRIEMLGDGFPCEIYGRLQGDSFESVIDFSDQGIHFDFPHFNGKFVKITAQRIDVSF